MKTFFRMLVLAGLLGNAAISNAQALLTSDVATVSSAEKTSFDKSPKYKKWQSRYVLNQVEYRADRVVFHITIESNGYGWSRFYSPKGEHPWFLRDKATGKKYDLLEVRNIRQGGELIAERVNGKEVTVYDDEDKDVTAEVHFAKLPKGVKLVDLIEGVGTEDRSNHFHYFNIALKTPTEKTPKAKNTQTPTEETAVAATEEPKNEAITKVEVGSFELYRVFPNPSNGLVNLTNLGASKEVNIQVVDLSGKVVFTQNSQAFAEKATIQLQLPNLPTGNYFVRVADGQQITSLPLVVEK